jgi:hypothetical protein
MVRADELRSSKPSIASDRDEFLKKHGFGGGCAREVIKERIGAMLRCLPLGSAHPDPESYAITVSRLFERYPEEVVRKVTDEVDGVPSMCRFVPGIVDLKPACEKLMADLVKARMPPVLVAEPGGKSPAVLDGLRALARSAVREP